MSEMNKPSKESAKRMINILEILNDTEMSGYYVTPSAPGGYAIVLISTKDIYACIECLNDDINPENDGGKINGMMCFTNRKDVVESWSIKKITTKSILDNILKINELVKKENSKSKSN